MLNQNRYKFTVKQPTQSQAGGQFTRPNPAGQNNRAIHAPPPLPPKVNQEILIDDKDDDDLLDISDTELIRASQAVESQLKFTNNVHHATSNAITIFSQFTNTQPVAAMPPPPQATIYSNSNLNYYDNIDDIKIEIKQLKNENMQKDGEVKILRDKLKRLEQETQKMRTEKVDLIKKLQSQQEEAKKILQKQIEFKEMENQFKSQEIVELTMKYKVLESSVRKNPNTVVLASTTPASNNVQKIQQPKSVPTKRSAQSNSLSDNENENPETIKRPLLQSNKNTPSIVASSRPSPQVNQAKNLISQHKVSYKRSSLLKFTTPSLNKTTINRNELIYKLTDRFADTVNFLTRTKSSIQDTRKRLIDLNTFLKSNGKQKMDFINSDRVDFICEKLNDELVKILNLKNFDLDSINNYEQIDLNCVVVESLYRLFIIRINFNWENLKQINTLKENFFLLIYQLIETLNFQTNKQNKLKNLNLLNYMTLKMLVTLFDFFNTILITPLNHEFTSKNHMFYLSLIDNMHSIFKNLNDTNLDDDDSCLFQMFYDKIIKFYNEIIYYLNVETSQCTTTDESFIPETNQPEIITTIVDETKNSKIDFKLENRISENYLLNNSITDADDIFQSQLDSANNHKVENMPPPVAALPPVFFSLNQATSKPHESQNISSEASNLTQIVDNLKIEFFLKFIYFLHNYQIFQSLESNMISNNSGSSSQANITEIIDREEKCSKKRKIYESTTNLTELLNDKNTCNNTNNDQKCACFKDMLNSFMCLINYQINDKSSKSKIKRSLDRAAHVCKANYLLDENKIVFNGSDISNNNGVHLNFLVLMSLQSFITLSTNEKFKADTEYMRKKLNILDSIRDDYRLKNFLCMYKLFETDNVGQVNGNQEDERMDVDITKLTRNHDDHLKTSINSLKSLFKSYLDDYFDLTQE